MSIKKLEEFHAAMWECFLIGKPVDHSWIGRLTVELTRFEPYFLNTADFNITYDEASSAAQNITCCVANAAKIPVHFQLDFGNDTFSKYDLIRKEKDITCATTTYKFFPQNNGKLLTCIVVYNHTLERLNNTSVRIDVKCIKIAPQISTHSPVQTLNDSTAYATIEFSSNPKSQLEWYVTPAAENEDSYIQIKDNEKYAMTYVSLKGDNYRATVKVKNVNEEDLNRKFKLRISNAHGDKELSFQIVSPDPGDESGKKWNYFVIKI
ncbi:hypothetical protein Ocin01_12653 [Orchesella cincta]|uniref:Uncharacterized protein n=1 Tax=Orchesella cincta TaxID=48709 RepID=A0A1D2MLZ0_ORCCI|nr:hypothetical protein Ocin01_12653 [Orchesella cincta]